MKLTIFLLLISVISVFAGKTYSQTKVLNLDMKNSTVKEVLQNIEAQSDFHFMYSEKLVDVKRKVTVNIKNKKIDEVLDELFSGTNVNYRIKDRFILLTTPEVSGNDLTIQQPKTVSGKVTDSDGQPLTGVTVIVKGTTHGTITDANGEYSLTSIPANVTLQFSFVGMKTQEIAVAGKTTINITMEEENIGIDEIVAIGYGTTKKVNLTGAVSMVTSERLEKRPIVSAGQGLQGVIPNLNITVKNGDPTESIDFNIRGYESINGGSPLVLVDGVPMDVDKINPNDIASVNVLKDAAAAAIYGARAAFGVVLIETKTAKSGKLNIQFNTEFSFTKPIFNVDPVEDPYEYATYYNTMYTRSHGVNYFDDYFLSGFKTWSENPTEENAWGVYNGVLRYYGNNRYFDKLIANYSPQQKYDLSISGASEKATYYCSFSFLDKNGFYKMSSKNEDFKRYNVVMKADFKVNDWLSLDEKIIFNSQVSNKPHNYGNDANLIALLRITEPVQFPDLDYYVEPGDHDKYAQYIGMYFGGKIAFPYLESGGRTTFTNNDTWLTTGATLTPVKGLKIRSDFSYNTYHKNYQDVASKVEVIATKDLLDDQMTDYGFSGDDYIENISTYNQYYVFNTYAEYIFDKYKDHYLKAMVGFNQEWGRYTSVGAKANTLLTTSITDLNATTGTQETSGSKNHLALRGLFYRLNYIYKDKYLLEANGRYDGSSRFRKNDRFGFFPSISLGWRISNESFMSGTKQWLDNLKIRASYGELGNQLLDDYYPYISTMESGMTPYIFDSGKSAYVAAAGLVSPSLSWETVATQNIGLDITTLDQRLDISFDAYKRTTKDMLMAVEYPDILGTDAPMENAADLETTGWELAVTWRDKINKDIDYGVTLGLSDWTAEITKYENPSGSLDEYYVGQKLGEIWGYETVGIFQYDDEVATAPDQSPIGASWQAGDIQYADLNDDDEISPGSNTLDDHGDLKIIGNENPRYSFGVNLDFRYKSWSLNAFFQGYLKRDYWPGGTDNQTWFWPGISACYQKYHITETWSEDNRDAYFYALYDLGGDGDKKNAQTQTRYMQDASYVRLKNLSIGYDLPRGILNKIGIKSTQIYLSGMNLWEYSKIHKPLDPETIQTSIIENPFERIFMIGARVSF